MARKLGDFSNTLGGVQSSLYRVSSFLVPRKLRRSKNNKNKDNKNKYEGILTRVTGMVAVIDFRLSNRVGCGRDLGGYRCWGKRGGYAQFVRPFVFSKVCHAQ